MSVGSVARAIAVLDALADSDDGLRVNELARRLDVNPSTASRLLATLQDGGLVERASGGRYRLGLRLLALSDRILARLDVRERARPWLEWLVDRTGETATLSVPGGVEAITVDFIPSSSSVVSMARVGRPSVPHATAVGKVMLAFGAGAEASLGEGPFVRFTERTITDPAQLARELERVRESGVAEAIGEREPDLSALAAPVLGRGDALVAIVGLQAPLGRLGEPERRTLSGPLQRAAAEINRAIGGRG